MEDTDRSGFPSRCSGQALVSVGMTATADPRIDELMAAVPPSQTGDEVPPSEARGPETTAR